MTNAYTKADRVDPGSKGGKRAALPEGHYPELLIEEVVDFQGKAENRHKRYYKVNLTVLVGPDGVRPGTLGCYLSCVEGNTHESYDDDEMAGVKEFVGAAFGLYGAEQVNPKIGVTQIMGTFAGDGRALAGHVVAATVTHAGKLDNPICKFRFQPVLVNGTFKKVAVQGSVKPNTPHVAGPAPVVPAAAAPAVTPPPVVAPAKPQPPAGHLPHPTPEWAAKGYYYDPATGAASGPF
jgi:hypothetical protein